MLHGRSPVFSEHISGAVSEQDKLTVNSSAASEIRATLLLIVISVAIRIIM